MLLAFNYKVNTPSNKLGPRFNYDVFKSFYESVRVNGCGAFILKNTIKRVFVVHDGPPYANGDPHDGHNLNKVLKDCIVRFKLALGYNVSYILGWDCNGLPIENKVMHAIQDDVADLSNMIYLRSKCNELASHYADRQLKVFKDDFLVLCSEYKYYTNSMDYAIIVVKVLFSLLDKGLIYIGNKPNYYSFQENTTLAFSEIEYLTIDGIELFFMFEVRGHDDLFILIMTTQPWTILGNKFVCVTRDVEYCIYSYRGKRIICSRQFGLDRKLILVSEISFDDILSMNYVSPFNKDGQFCIIGSDLAKGDIGTGLVHCAPAHGLDDYAVYVDSFGLLEVNNCVDLDGNMLDESFAGCSILDGTANSAVIKFMEQCDLLFSVNSKQHSYPVSWRSKKPAYIIAIEQVFIKLNDQVLSDIAVSAQNVSWFGYEGLQTFNSYLETRTGDWSIARQRAHGTPCVFIKQRSNGAILNDRALNNSIIEYARENGFDFWFDKDREVIDQLLLRCSYDPEQFDVLQYVIDVWLDSGVSTIYLMDKYGLSVDVVVEGRDQHRGWFQTSALLRYLYDGLSPSCNVVVHGFIKASTGNKLSKSTMNDWSQSLCSQYNQEVFRLSVLRSDYKFDICVTGSVLSDNKTLLFRIYNLLRYVVNMSYIADSSFSTNFDSFNVLIRYFVSKFNSAFSSFIFEMDAYNFSSACAILVNCFDFLSELIRVSKDVTYCSTMVDNATQEYICSMLYMFSRLLFMIYPYLPVTCCYVIKVMYDVPDGFDEEELIDRYLLPGSDIVSVALSSQERSLVDDVYSLFDVFNERLDGFKKDQLVGHNYELYVYHSLSDLDSSLIESVFGVSCCVFQSSQYEADYLFSIVWKEALVYVVYVGNVYKKCLRCWKYYSHDSYPEGSVTCKICMVNVARDGSNVK